MFSSKHFPVLFAIFPVCSDQLRVRPKSLCCTFFTCLSLKTKFGSCWLWLCLNYMCRYSVLSGHKVTSHCFIQSLFPCISIFSRALLSWKSSAVMYNIVSSLTTLLHHTVLTSLSVLSRNCDNNFLSSFTSFSGGITVHKHLSTPLPSTGQSVTAPPLYWTYSS